MSDRSFVQFVLDQLQGIDHLAARRMFGGFGLYSGRTFFGIVYKDRLYFKTSAVTAADYTRRGMSPFQPNAKQTLKSYFEVPPEVLENAVALREWARRAIAPGA